jgi:hypothetical protein
VNRVTVPRGRGLDDPGRPGGHADEPGNANADYQFQGEQ